MASTSDVLRRSGLRLSEAEFAGLLEEALAGLVEPTVRTDDPRQVLTPTEVAVLEAGGADLSPRRPDEADPRAGTAAAYAAVLASALSVPEAAARLGVDPSRVRHRLAERRLYGIRLRRGWRLPSFQFAPDGLVPGIDEVLPHLPEDLHPVAAWQWLRIPVAELEMDDRATSPLEWLRAGGDPAPVANLAAALAVTS